MESTPWPLTTPPPKKPRLNPKTLRVMRKRREWRQRALESALSLTTWPTGKPGREKAESETIKCLNKVRQWFRQRKARIVIDAIQRRAVAAFRQQQQFQARHPAGFAP